MGNWFWTLAAAWALGIGCNKPIDQDEYMAAMEMEIRHKVAGHTLELEKATVTPFGEPVTFSNFQYYLSNFSLINAGGNIVSLPVSYFLVSEKDTASKTIGFNIPGGVYRGLRITIGVDSARNVSGVQSGALDPANGMFWSWNTGYIFAKLEGKSPLSTAPLQNVTYHIGGFKTGQNALQSVTLNFPTQISVPAKAHVKIALSANLDKWFEGVSPITIAKEPFCMEPGELAQRIAANYAQMFTIVSVTQ